MSTVIKMLYSKAFSADLSIAAGKRLSYDKELVLLLVELVEFVEDPPEGACPPSLLLSGISSLSKLIRTDRFCFFLSSSIRGAPAAAAGGAEAPAGAGVEVALRLGS